MLKILAIVGLIIVVFVLVTFAITWIWGWVVPDIFGGMVRAELLPASITFLQAIKLTFLLAILGISGRGGSK